MSRKAGKKTAGSLWLQAKLGAVRYGADKSLYINTDQAPEYFVYDL